MVAEDFELDSLPRCCWEDLVVDHLLVVGCFLDSCLGCFCLALVSYWGMAGWDGFVVQTLVPKEQVELGWGLEWLALVVHSRLGGLGVLQTWESVPHIIVSTK